MKAEKKYAFKSILEIKRRYNVLQKRMEKEYCAKNCSDIPSDINKLLGKFTEYNP